MRTADVGFRLMIGAECWRGSLPTYLSCSGRYCQMLWMGRIPDSVDNRHVRAQVSGPVGETATDSQVAETHRLQSVEPLRQAWDRRRGSLESMNRERQEQSSMRRTGATTQVSWQFWTLASRYQSTRFRFIVQR